VNAKIQPDFRQSEIKLILRLRQLEREPAARFVLLDLHEGVLYVAGQPEHLAKHVTPSLTADSD